MAYGCVSRRPGAMLAAGFASMCMGSAFLVLPRAEQGHAATQVVVEMNKLPKDLSRTPSVSKTPSRSADFLSFTPTAALAGLGAALALSSRRRERAERAKLAARVSAAPQAAAVFKGQLAGGSQTLLESRSESAVTCYAKKKQNRGVPMSERQGYIKDAKVLYLKKRNYKNRHKKNLRNRAYNLCYKNRFKAVISKIYRLCKQMSLPERPENVPNSMEEARAVFEPMFEEACFKIDDAAVQGVVSKEEAMFRKDMMFKRVMDACATSGFLELPEDVARTPAFEVLEYEVPQNNMLREPKPWQLPGWKSPWTLFREFQQWENWRVAKAKEEAENATKVEEVEEAVAA